MPRARHRAPHPLAGAAPKSKMTSYAFFVQLCREEHRRVHPDEEVLFAEFGRKCAERWKTMSELEKKRFNQMAEEDAKRYHLEMAAFEAGREAAARRGLHQRKRHELAFNSPPPTEHPTNPALNPDGTRKRKKRKKKDPNAPKRAMSAFFWFSQDERAKVRAANPDFGVGDTAKELSRRWAESPPEVRSKFESLAERDRARYDSEKQDFQKGLFTRLAPAANPAAALAARLASLPAKDHHVPSADHPSLEPDDSIEDEDPEELAEAPEEESEDDPDTD